MKGFKLTTIWRIPAPIELVWEELLASENWPMWWKYVKQVEQIATGNEFGINNIRSYVWNTCLPYQLRMDLCITQLLPYQFIETAVSGDLKGIGSCNLSYNNHLTTLQYQWDVCLDRNWMKWVSPLAYPIFIWNHQRVMKQGEISLINRLAELDIVNPTYEQHTKN